MRTEVDPLGMEMTDDRDPDDRRGDVTELAVDIAVDVDQVGIDGTEATHEITDDRDPVAAFGVQGDGRRPGLGERAVERITVAEPPDGDVERLTVAVAHVIQDDRLSPTDRQIGYEVDDAGNRGWAHRCQSGSPLLYLLPEPDAPSPRFNAP